MGADLSAPQSATKPPTVLPIGSIRSYGQFTPIERGIGGSILYDWVKPRSQPRAERKSRTPCVRAAAGDTVVSRRGKHLGTSGQKNENRRHHHDRLARTGHLGGSRACPLWSHRRPQEPTVPNDLALAFSAKANAQGGRRGAGLVGCAPQAMPAPGAQRAGPAIRKAKPFLLQGNRLYWFLTILAATAVASVIIGRIMIASGVGPGLTH